MTPGSKYMSTWRACQLPMVFGVNPLRMAQLLFVPPGAAGVVMETAKAPLPWVMALGGPEVTMLRVEVAPDQVPLAVRVSALLNRIWQEVVDRVGVKVWVAAAKSHDGMRTRGQRIVRILGLNIYKA